jgi:DNA-binding NtrC family response regulator
MWNATKKASKVTPKADRNRILVVDDAPDTLEVVRRYLSAAGYRAFCVPSAPEAVRLLEREPMDLVITDLKMPRVSGLDLVRHIRENYRDTEVVMITGYASVGSAVKAIQAGAQEYLPKPFTETELLAVTRNALEKLQLRKKGRTTAPLPQYGLIGQSPAMQAVFSAIAKSAPTRATVLITGESGTGKELIARAIHYNSPRRSAPFVPINCSSIPEPLLESELFGHVRGAFTGADQSRAGFFQTADGGTIFLDEVSDTSLAMQSKLLRVLQDGEVVMVGSTKPRKVDVRIVAASNKDLAAVVRKALFREDLYFRLNVLSIQAPPLRERGDDILLLVRHFADRFAAETGKPPPRFSDNALRSLRTYRWPGNVRELENVVHRLVVMSESEVVEAPDLPVLMRFSALHDSGLDRTLAEVEAEYIHNVLAKADGNQSRAASILGIDRKTLHRKLRALGPGTS